MNAEPQVAAIVAVVVGLGIVIVEVANVVGVFSFCCVWFCFFVAVVIMIVAVVVETLAVVVVVALVVVAVIMISAKHPHYKGTSNANSLSPMRSNRGNNGRSAHGGKNINMGMRMNSICTRNSCDYSNDDHMHDVSFC